MMNYIKNECHCERFLRSNLVSLRLPRRFAPRNDTTIRIFFYIVCIFIFTGCQTTRGPKQSRESLQETKEAVVSVAEALSGKELTEEEANNLVKEINSNPEVQSAVESIKNSFDPQEKRIKYCPSTGKRYAAHLDYSLECDVKLEWLE